MFWLAKEDRETWPWNLLPEKRQNTYEYLSGLPRQNEVIQMNIFFENIFPSLLGMVVLSVPTIIIQHIKSGFKNNNRLLEESITNGHTVTAYLKKAKPFSTSYIQDDKAFYMRMKQYNYKGIYTYKYKRKTYKTSSYFEAYPPDSLTLYFINNPRDVSSPDNLWASSVNPSRIFLISFIVSYIVNLLILYR